MTDDLVYLADFPNLSIKSCLGTLLKKKRILKNKRIKNILKNILKNIFYASLKKPIFHAPRKTVLLNEKKQFF